MTLSGLLSRQRRFVYLLVALVSAAGVWAALRMPSAIYPELTFPRIGIVAQGSALGARQVVFGISRPIEEAVSVVPGVLRVRSRSIRGSAEVNVDFLPNTDMAQALQQVQARVSQVQGTLPPGIDVEVERLTPSVFPILSYNLLGASPTDLYDLAQFRIRPVVSRIPGVGRVDVQSSDVREIEVVADPARLTTLGLSYGDLADAIKAEMNSAAVGRVSQDYKQLLVVTDQETHTVDDVANVVVRPGTRVSDLAEVRLGTEDHTRLVAGNGRPAALINVTRQVGGSTVAIADSVQAVMAELQKTLPRGVTVTPVYDQAVLVRDAVGSVRDAMLIGAILAVVILLLFLRHGPITAISAASIPITMAISVFGMWLLGQTFNLMSLGGMAIAIGLVIDDSVVVTENIARHLAFTPDRSLAIRDAVAELVWPVVTSTITTVVVFVPLGLLEGVVGQFFKALSITLSLAVLVSLFLALTLIPLLAEQFVKAGEEEDPEGPIPRGWRGIPARIARFLHRLTLRYERALAALLRRPRLVVIPAVLLIVGGYFAQKFVGTGFLPEMDEGAFVLDYFTPGGTALEETDRQVHVAERILAQTPEIEGTSRRTGAELGLFATEQNVGDMVVRLKPRSQRSRTIFQVIEDVRGRLEHQVPRLQVEFVQILSDVINDLAGSANPVEIKVFGDRLDEMEAYARKVSAPLEKVDGLVDLFNGVSEPSPELLLRVDQARAGQLGMTADDVNGQVAAALLGAPAGEVRAEDRTIGVRVHAPDAVRFDPARLGSLPVFSPSTHQEAPLGTVATVREEDSRAELRRENQRQMIAITGGVEGRSLGEVMTDVKAVLAANPPPPGLRVEIGGQYAGQQAAFKSLLAVLALAALSVVAVMVVQFESFVEPLVIVLAAPLSFVGAVALLLATGTPLNVSSLMGLVLLVGLIVKNGIILLDFTQHRMRHEGEPLGEAILAAARTRLRPILMTTLCTLFGLAPLALGLGAGAELQRPLALAVIGGLALSTPITLFAVPALLVAIRGPGYRLHEREDDATPAPAPLPHPA
ncbi:MAG TPA: efflux RND transporter permease subunit [Longimicrobiaceae bacterium]|nr:efflux RND transporter permease subunit [Longimicrobiaceae bacterium]